MNFFINLSHIHIFLFIIYVHNLNVISMQYYLFFINPIKFIFNFSIIWFILSIYLNQLLNNFINLCHFHVYQFYVYALNLIIICMQYYLYFINLVHFIFFIIDIYVLNLSVIFMQNYCFFINPFHFIFDDSII